MANRFLLGTDALLELSAAGPNPTKAWAESVRLQHCKLSVVAVGMAFEVIKYELAADLARQQGWERGLRTRLAELERLGVPTLAVNDKVIEEWIPLRRHPLVARDAGSAAEIVVSQDTRLVIATAKCFGLALAELDQPYHATLRQLGMDVISIA
jgi:hypothetical protein